MNDLFVLALGWLLVLVVFLSFLSLRRYLEHRERMAMIIRGITPPDKRRNTLSTPLLVRRTGVLQGGLITAMVGLALTLGLYPIGYIVPPAIVGPYHLGPWLLAGLIPLAVGSALIIGHYLTPGRPVETPPAARTDDLEHQTNRPEHSTPSPWSISGRAEPIALPEPRRWMLYRRASDSSTGPAETPAGNDDQDALPKAEP
jgi:hypothetical protein